KRRRICRLTRRCRRTKTSCHAFCIRKSHASSPLPLSLDVRRHVGGTGTPAAGPRTAVKFVQVKRSRVMKLQFVVLALSLCFFSLAAVSSDCVTAETPLLQLLNQYSQEYGTKFVVDPRVRAKVTLVGVDPGDLDSGALIGVLNVHGFAAFAKE